jgi:hypothetical protein
MRTVAPCLPYAPNCLEEKFSATVHALGVAPDYLLTLEVTGRHSGRPISFPLVMVIVDGERYLVSMLGPGASWVRNLRAADGRAVLRHGKTERVRLEEVPVGKGAGCLRLTCDARAGRVPTCRWIRTPRLRSSTPSPLGCRSSESRANPTLRVPLSPNCAG